MRTLALAFALGFSCSASAAERITSQSRPNILVCMADDWGYPHASAYGDKVVKTPAFDRVAREGFLFTHAFSAAPSCTPSRAAILTGQAPHRLEEGGNLHGFLPKKFPVYPDLLENAGYIVGFTGKSWGPGNFQAGGRTRNPAGPNFKSFQAFLKTVPADKPFCFWFGSGNPHRPYEKGSGAAAGMKPEDAVVPPYLPDTQEIRSDILDYYFEVQRFDRAVGEVLQALADAGKSENTLVVITGDNGWPFPRSKANLYDSGTRQPFAVRWPGKFTGGKTIDAFINLADLAPTFLDAAGLKPSREMTGQSLLPLLAGKKQRGRDMVFVERERHANVRAGDLSYPARAVRTREFLYIRNLRADRWPAGDPEVWKAVGPFGDCDGSPSKEFILAHRSESEFAKFFELGFSRRPAEELYDLARDPHQVTNVSGLAEYAAAKKKLRITLDRWMKDTKDPRAFSDDEPWNRYPYFGGPPNRMSRQTANLPPETEAVSVFNRQDLSGFYTWLVDTKYEDPRRVFSVTNGVLRISGEGLGYIATKGSHSNYRLLVEFKWGSRNWAWGDRIGKARDSGIFLHSIGPDGNSHDGQGAFKAAIECNLFEGATGDLLLIRGNASDNSLLSPRFTAEMAGERDADSWPFWKQGGKRETLERWGRVNWFAKDRQWQDRLDFRGAHDVEKPVGEWNQVECRCDANRIQIRLNGVLVNEAFDVWPTNGPILLQCEGSEIFVRKFELQTLK